MYLQLWWSRVLKSAKPVVGVSVIKVSIQVDGADTTEGTIVRIEVATIWDIANYAEFIGVSVYILFCFCWIDLVIFSTSTHFSHVWRNALSLCILPSL